MQEDDFPITPRWGTIIFGFVKFIGGAVAIWTVRQFKRKTLIVGGHSLMGICHLVVGLAGAYAWNTGSLTFILLFIVVYSNTSGPIAWIYAAETNVDSAIGISLMWLWGVVFIETLVCPPLMVEPE